MRRAVISGSGVYTPDNLVPNAVFDERFGPGVGDWLVRNLDIRQRYWMSDDQATSDLIVEAARVTLADAGLGVEEVDLLIVATDTSDYLSPSTASVVQHKLGLRKAGAFDLNSACAGFVTAVDMAAKYIAADPTYRHILVVGAYGMSRFLNQNDKKTVTLFADGAGAVLLSANDDPSRGFLGADLECQGQYAEWMGVYGGGTARPSTPESLAANDHRLVFARKFPKEINPETWTRMVQSLCERLEITPGDVDHYVFTQLNINSIRETLDNLGIPHDRTTTVMDRVGYTGSACIPMALDAARKQGAVKQGDLVMLVASGGGLSFAAAAIRL
jgi:3-oxoacyl-[acyl-carrier-protein] synthase-3